MHLKSQQDYSHPSDWIKIFLMWPDMIHLVCLLPEIKNRRTVKPMEQNVDLSFRAGPPKLQLKQYAFPALRR